MRRYKECLFMIIIDIFHICHGNEGLLDLGMGWSVFTTKMPDFIAKFCLYAQFAIYFC